MMMHPKLQDLQYNPMDTTQSHQISGMKLRSAQDNQNIHLKQH